MTTPAQNVNLWPWHYENIVIRYNGSQTATTQASTQDSSSFRQRPASGKSPVRPNGTRAPRKFDHSWLEFSITPVRCLQTSGLWTYSGNVGVKPVDASALYRTLTPWFGGFAFPLNTDMQCRANFFKKLASGKAQLGAALGEARETARGIHAAAEEVSNFLTAAAAAAGSSRGAIARYLRGAAKTIRGSRRTKSGKLRRDYLTEKGLEEVRNRWLQTQFELKPLIGDIHDAGQALSDLLFDPSTEGLFTIRAGAEDFEIRKVYLPLSIDRVSTDGLVLPLRVTSQQHISAVYKIPVNRVRTINQLGLGNPLAVVWEVTAFSWLVDYVLGVGDWLSSMFVDDDGTTFVEGSISRIQRVALDSRPYVGKSHISGSISADPTVANFAAGKFVRSVLDGRVIPPVLPAVRVHMGLNQMANTLSVLSQIVGSPSRVNVRAG